MKSDRGHILIPKLAKSLRILSLIAPMLAMGCGGASQTDAESASAIEGLVSQFGGISSLDKGNDNSWTVRWNPIDVKGVVYAIFSAKEGEEINFDQPVDTTQEDIYKYTPKNIFAESATCFAVRINNFSGDENDNALCTTDQPFSFDGANEIERQSDGSYVIRWTKIPVEGTIYSVFEKTGAGEYNFELPSYDAIKEAFFKSELFERGNKTCFVVRYYHPDLPVDENLTEQCTEDEEPIDFGGIKTLSSNSSSQVTMGWDAAASTEVSGYRIYQGSDFKELVGTVEANVSTFSKDNLVPERQYSFGIRAIDEFGREDKNLKILSVVMPAN